MNTIFIKRALGRLWSLTYSRRPRRIVLLYHAVGDGPNAISRSLFQKQMEWLAGHADVLSLDDLLAGAGSKPIRVSIGFDDGYASVVDQAEPILSALTLPATVYLNTGWIGESSRRASDPTLGHYPGEYFMSWEDAQKLEQRGWTIGSHGVEHLDLTVEGAANIVTELCDSKHMIDTRLSVVCKHFAYTWGRFNIQVQRAARTAGYHTAASAIHGPVDINSDLFALPRIDIRKTYSIDDFKAIIRGDWDYLGKMQRIRRSVKYITGTSKALKS